ncbi:ABSCISIC ACID-INSENSITIVE 5-like protein 2 isoform X2 [Vicia villosa]|uniref:ABSCISIC ACID-INSENSITIVE 5-like protein 2 isoform X2 n=1 Tax=Vicia villosa TaxID=3911 RepID=UPI00273A7BA7|nr:ABSCISIC ACID-INSENSITIVE 5-like protein 2 isoform X2 [Vicia villosa]
MVSQSGTVQESKTTTPLSRSGSLYNLTLDEVQNHLGNLGKPLGSMNLDELLKSVWSVEAGEVSDFGTANMQQNQLSEMNRQGSLSLSGDISKKTVDEVWKDMQEKKRGVDRDREARERQQTLGEMTLEDFLMKAGVVGESFHNKEGGDLLRVDSNEDSRQNVSQHGHHWMQFQLPSTQQPPQHQHEKHLMPSFMAVHAIQQPFQVARNPVLDAAMSPSSLMDTQTLGRKRVASGIVVEKTVERRQKRMIKNRESAARSRARRQAYTQELELKVSRLEEENERLRRQNEIEKEVPCAPPPEPKNQLRRTNSASF